VTGGEAPVTMVEGQPCGERLDHEIAKPAP